MRLLTVLVLFFYSFPFAFSQETKSEVNDNLSDMGKISLTIVFPEKLEELDATQISKLQSKVIQIVTANGLGAKGYSGKFVIYPKFAINETNLVEGGMENITVTSCDLSLYIKELDTNILYASVSKTLKGSGKNKIAALNNAIQQIDSNEKTWKTFIESGKSKIIQYYESKCNDIIAKADVLIKAEDFERAIGNLLFVPEELGVCYAKAQAKALEAFKALKEKLATKYLANAKLEFEKGNYYEGLNQIQKIDSNTTSYVDGQALIKTNRENLCKQLVMKAKASIATKDFVGAAAFLKAVNPDSSCLTEAQELTKDLETKFTAEDKRNWELKLKQIQDQVDIKKDEILAMKEIAIAIAQSQPKTTTYNNVIK